MNLRIIIILLALPLQILAGEIDDFSIDGMVARATNNAFVNSMLHPNYVPCRRPQLSDEELNKKFCENQLNYHIQSLMNSHGNDSELLSYYYQIAQMKLTAQVLINSDQSKLTLEQLIKEKIKRASQFDEQVFKTNLIELYKEHGIEKSMGDADDLLKKFKDAEFGKDDKVLKGTDIPVMANFIRRFTPDEKCRVNPNLAVCLNEADEATLWLAAQMNRSNKGTTETTKNNLEPSYVIAHYSGHALHKDHRKEQALTPEEVLGRIKEYDSLVKQEIMKMGEEFLNEFDECKSVFGNSECLYQTVMSIIPKNLNILAKAVGKVSEMTPYALSLSQEENKNGISVPYLTLRNGIRLNMGLDEVFVDKVKDHQRSEAKRLAQASGVIEELVGHTVAWEQEEVKMCGGQLFKPEMKNMQAGGLDPKSFKGAVGAFKNGSFLKNNGKGAYMDALADLEADKAAEKGNKSKWVGFTKKLFIPGGLFRCEMDPVLKPPFMSGKTAEKKVCCNDKPDWGRMGYLFFSGSTGFHCRAFFGVPYIAEIGVKAGVGVTVTGGGGWEPNGCEDTEVCGQASVAFDASVAAYAEAAGGAAGAQATVAWQPYASLKQCGLERWGRGSSLPPARFNYKIGIFTYSLVAKIGWVASYHKVGVLYSNDKNQEHDIVIF